MKDFFPVFYCILLSSSGATAQDASSLMKQIQFKLEKINDYEADARLKTQIPFLKVPDAAVTVYYKKPDKIKIRNQNGISLVPKETVSISLYSLVNGSYKALDAGSDTIRGMPVRIIKLLPSDENGELVLATLYVDTRSLLILKAKTTTRENGTDEVELFYGKFIQTTLPDKIVFSFNTQDFKLPKGVTFDYDDGSVKKKAIAPGKNERGKIEITYLSYQINKGLSESVFK
jgi:outer membrane lipoprotein-sorting protein